MLPLLVQGEADGITVTQAIGPFIKKTRFIDPPRRRWSLETLARLRTHEPDEVSTSNKCLLLQDLSPLQCFNQRVTGLYRARLWSAVALDI